MARNRRFQGGQHNKNRARPSHAPTLSAVPAPPEKKRVIVYGKPVVILEDESKNTFEYQGGKWIPYELTIAECRANGQVKELPQKVNRMTRYEVCRALDDED